MIALLRIFAVLAVLAFGASQARAGDMPRHSIVITEYDVGADAEIADMTGLEIVLVGRDAVDSPEEAKTAVADAFRSKYGPRLRNTFAPGWDGKQLYVFYHERSRGFRVSHMEPPDRVVGEKPPDALPQTATVTITREHVLASPASGKLGSLENRIARMEKEAAGLRGTDAHAVLQKAIAELTAERDAHLKTFDDATGCEIVLYGRDAVRRQDEFINAAIALLSAPGVKTDGRECVVHGFFHRDEPPGSIRLSPEKPDPAMIRR